MVGVYWTKWYGARMNMVVFVFCGIALWMCVLPVLLYFGNLGSWAAFGCWGCLWVLGMTLGAGADFGCWGCLWVLGLTLGSGAAFGFWG